MAEGDTWIPGPWLVAGADPALNAVPGIGSTALARPDVAIMNALGVNASALGNHEYDLGSPIVAGAIYPAGPWVGAQFPLITDNLDFAGDTALKARVDSSLGGTGGSLAGLEASVIKGKIAPSTVVTINGEKIGIVGATTWDLLTKTSPNGTIVRDDGNAATDKLHETAAYVQAAVNGLTAAGVNKIVMVDQLDTIDRNKNLAPLVSGIDVMVAGGGHERLGDANDTAFPFNGHSATFAGTYPQAATALDGKPMLIVTTDTEYTYLGRLVVGFDSSGVLDATSLDSIVNGAYAASEPTLQSVYGTSDPASSIVAASPTGAKIKAISSAINSIVTVKDGNKYGFSNVYLEGDRVFGRAQEVNLGDITADANIVKARQALGAGPFITSLKNGGGLRSSIGSIDEDGNKVANPILPGAAGNVSQLDVENALRFDNKMMVFDTTPLGLLNILNYGVSLAPGNGGFPQIGGLRFSYNPTLPAGSRVRSVALYDEAGSQVAKVVENGLVVAGAPTTISMIALNFTANGGDGYPIKGTANGSNYRFVLNDGTLSAPVSESLDFTAAGVVPANALGEQKAFEDYLRSRHATQASAYNVADTPPSGDLRIENLSARTDAVFDTTPPLLTVPGDITTNATSPAGASVQFSVSAADPVEGGSPVSRPVTCKVGATVVTSPSVFPIGTTTVTCTASDLAGNTSTRSFAVTVVGSVGQIEALQGKVGSLPSLQQTKKDAKTIAKLNEGLAKVQSKKKLRDQCRGLDQFILAVQHRTSKKTPPKDGRITAAEAAEVTVDAKQIQAALGC